MGFPKVLRQASSSLPGCVPPPSRLGRFGLGVQSAALRDAILKTGAKLPGFHSTERKRRSAGKGSWERAALGSSWVKESTEPEKRCFFFLRFTLLDPKGRVGNTEFGNDTTATPKNQALEALGTARCASCPCTPVRGAGPCWAIRPRTSTAEIQSPTKAGNS